MIYRDNSDMQQGEDITKQKKTVASEKTILSADDITTHYDLDGLIPGKGDPRRPPEWLSRALLMVAISILIFTFVWDSWGLFITKYILSERCKMFSSSLLLFLEWEDFSTYVGESISEEEAENTEEG